ncbi:MAG: hypothetical protein KDC11_02040, partial [Chitinophagaceae bacterium]|nr:hypothetical protein [Chitinophagaceae bacterium]
KTPKPTNPKPVEATLPETSARQRERSATLMATAQEPVPTAKRPIDQMDAAIVQSELPAPVISSEEKKVLAMQTPFSSTRQSIALLEEAVGEKLAMAKNIKDNIKDREVTFQLGKKELFTLKL